MPDSALSKLTTDELTAALAPVQKVLTNIAQGDGSTASLAGQGVILEGELIAALPNLQKIGVTELAADLNQKITDFLTSRATQTGAQNDNTGSGDATTSGQ